MDEPREPSVPAPPKPPKLNLAELLDLKLPEPPVPALAKLNLPALPKPPKLNLAELLDLKLPELSVPALAIAPQPELIKPDDRSGRSASLELRLAVFEPAFANQFRGARLRGEERGPDWLTQAAASFRKLLLGMLHAAAPDEFVLPWVQDRKRQLDRNGHPTRSTKIEWLCRSIQSKGYRTFVKHELRSALEVLELLSRAVHVNDFPELEESFESAAARVEFAIGHILRLSGRQRSS